MGHQSIIAILNHLSLVDITGPLIPLIPNDMGACASEGKVIDNAFQKKKIFITQILRAHGIKHISLEAGREFGDSATFNSYLQQEH
jgi:hypothetical protein